jgi:hypothetical protein
MVRRIACVLLTVAVVMSLIACGGDDDDGGENSDGVATQAPADSGRSSTPTSEGGGSNNGSATGPTNENGQSFTGQLEMSGDVEGTFIWNPELAVTLCLVEGIEITMTDGVDIFITLRSNTASDETTIFSGTFPDSYTRPGAKIDAEWGGQIGDPISGTAAFDTTLQGSDGDGTVEVNGTLNFYCP